jgi:hypothetical protein
VWSEFRSRNVVGVVKSFLDTSVQGIELLAANLFWAMRNDLGPRYKCRKFPLILCEKDERRICARVRAALKIFMPKFD